MNASAPRVLLPGPAAERTGPGMLPELIEDERQLDELLSAPTDAAIRTMASLAGDLLVLGVGGKMGPTLARMAKRASDEAGVSRRVIGVSRFSDAAVRERLAGWGVETIAGDLLDRAFVAGLPDAPHVISMAGMKFGSSGNEPLTWAMNAWLPAILGERFRRSRIAAFSTGNVYGLVSKDSGGSIETDAPNPVGEYAMSCLGRERMFEYCSTRYGIPTAVLRLNYATELRYGVLVDLARKVVTGEPVDLSMSLVNVIWQGDANAMTLCALADCTVPANVLNVAGPEILRVRDVCEQLGAILNKVPRFTGTETDDALLNNGAAAHARYGRPRISVDQMLHWIADWVRRGGASLGKPTHFESRDGRF